MTNVLPSPARRPLRVLAVGAHPDDIEIGCGASLAAHVAAGDEVWMFVLTRGEQRSNGQRVHEQQAAADILGAKLLWGPFTDGTIPSDVTALHYVDQIVSEIGPDVMYTHAGNDSHQDHRATAQLTLACARKMARILQWKAPSSLGFTPTVFVDVSDTLQVKIDAIAAHTSQLDARVDPEVLTADAVVWGHQARVRYAEGFETPRFLWNVR
jgi:LmbE family N-acetylglucosaminyl deacetylase